jgi:hypothetical protein
MKIRNLILAFCFACAIIVPTAAENDREDDYERALPVPDRWIAPPPEEKALLDIIADWKPDDAKTIRDITMSGGIAGLFVGTLLSASGVYYVYAAAANGPDVGAMHDSVGMVISGSLVTAISSMLLSASSQAPASAQE